jgi:hypothetical protein
MRAGAASAGTSLGPAHRVLEARRRCQQKKLCAMKTSVFHAAVMACAILLSTLFPSEPAVAQGCPTPSFGPPNWFGAGVSPDSMAVGDFNGDGKPDLAILGSNGGPVVSVLLGNGDGTFQAPIEFPGPGYRSIVGDFNGDGKLDLAVADGNSGTVSVLLGNGDGTFQAAPSYPAGVDPISIAVGDFNRDGKLDLVVANKGTIANNFTDSSVLVLLGNGDGTFQAAAEYGPVVNPYSVAVGDFNGDGNLDLAVADAGDPLGGGAGAGVSVLLGNGDGTFQSAVTYDAGVRCFLVGVGDFNGDGKPDLAVLGPPDRVLLGNGDGTFQNAIPFPPGYYTYTSPLAMGDFNGDGKLDLVVADSNARGSVDVLLGNGDGTFQTPVNYGWGMDVTSGFAHVAVGDFNRDGKPDLFVGISLTGGGSVATVLLNTCVSASPSLAIMVTNSTLTVSWPFPSTGFVLESTPSLSPPDWQPAPESAVTNNALLEVMVPVNPGTRYFRLHQP